MRQRPRGLFHASSRPSPRFPHKFSFFVVVFPQLPGEWWETPGGEENTQGKYCFPFLLFTYKRHRNISVHFGVFARCFF